MLLDLHGMRRRQKAQLAAFTDAWAPAMPSWKSCLRLARSAADRTYAAPCITMTARLQ